MTAETMYPVRSWPETPRVYVDTSVFSACEDEKYWIRESSRKLYERFRAGDMTLVLSAAVASELDSATEAARALPGTVPRKHSEFLEPSGAAEELADRYIEAGAVDAAKRPVALHVAFATLANADTLASWNHKHLLNLYRRPRFNAVNRELGHPRVEMHEPPAILGENFRDPNDKSFDCVAFMREQRDSISRKLETMTPEERVEWRNNREITDPILRRIWDRSPRAKLLPLRLVADSGVRKAPVELRPRGRRTTSTASPSNALSGRSSARSSRTCPERRSAPGCGTTGRRTRSCGTCWTACGLAMPPLRASPPQAAPTRDDRWQSRTAPATPTSREPKTNDRCTQNRDRGRRSAPRGRAQHTAKPPP